MTLPSGTRLGHYTILSALGAGGMGEVYEAEDTKLKRRVAIKVLQALVAGDPDRRERFEREARAVAALSHPNIVTIYSVEEAGDVPFLTMELVDGRTLDQVVPRGGLAPGELVQIAIPLADAVGAAHQRGIVHRDLKPGNVMIDAGGRVKVLDFGLAKLTADATAVAGLTAMPTGNLTGEGRILGTVAYMAPEQAEGKVVDQRSDIFALGVLLYEMATGERPFKGDTGVSLISSILRDTPPSLTDLRADLPRDLGRIVKRCLVKDPQRRYQSAIDLRNDLEELRQEMDASVAPPLSPAEATFLSPRVWLLGATGVAAIVLAVSGYFAWQRRAAPDTPPAAAIATAAPVVANRVAVALFENRTGDPTLDGLGRMTADSLIQGIAEIGNVDVEPSAVSLASTGGASAAARLAEVVRRAADTKAATLVTGGYYLQGDTLEFQAQVIDTPGGTLLHALPPIGGPRAAPRQALEALRQRVMGAVALRFSRNIDLRHTSHAPTYEAYQEYSSCLDLFGKDYATAIRHCEKALQIDPEFMPPRSQIAVSYGNEGRWAEAAKTLAPLVERRNRLTEFERLWVDWYQAVLGGRQTEALALLTAMGKIAPDGHLINYITGLQFMNLNRPREALDLYARVPVEKWAMGLGTAAWRYGVAATAAHLLGDYQKELTYAHEAVRVAPQSLSYRGAEARALIGLKQSAEALQAVESLLSLPGAAGPAMLAVARELRAHGDRQASLALAERTVSWYRNRSPEAAKTEAARAGLARALYAAERWAEAHVVCLDLAKQFADNVDYKGVLGAIAAREGHAAGAKRYSDDLRRIEAPYIFGRHTHWRARIAALLGDTAAAVDLLREGFAQGESFSIERHRDMDLEPLRDVPAFRELMRPKD